MFLRFKRVSQFKPLKPIGTKDIMAYKQLREDGIFRGQEKIDLYGVMKNCVEFGIDFLTKHPHETTEMCFVGVS